MSKDDIRLRLLEVLIPAATRYSITNPNEIIATCRILEDYVVHSANDDEGLSDSSGRNKPGRPRKGQAEVDVPAFLDPALMVDKSN